MPLNLSKLHRHKVHFEETVPEIPEVPAPVVEEKTQSEPIEEVPTEVPILFNGRDEDFQSDEELEEPEESEPPEADEEEEEDTDKIIEELVSMRVKKEVAKMKAELQKTKPQASGRQDRPEPTEAKAEGQEQSSFFGTAAKMLAIPAAMMFAGPLINMGAKALTVQALRTAMPMPPMPPGTSPGAWTMPPMSSENPGQPIMPSFAMPTQPSLRHPEQYAGFLRT